ncbi:membrane protein [Arthrobacter phage Hankly]|nr:membrane protein [Arthrobacter phage Hankly]
MVYNITSLPSPKKTLIRKGIVLGGTIIGGLIAFALVSRSEPETDAEVEYEETVEEYVTVDTDED